MVAEELFDWFSEVAGEQVWSVSEDEAVGVEPGDERGFFVFERALLDDAMRASVPEEQTVS